MDDEKKNEFQDRIAEIAKEFGLDRFLCFGGKGEDDLYYVHGDQTKLVDGIVAVTKADDDIKPVMIDTVTRLNPLVENWIFEGLGGDAGWPETPADESKGFEDVPGFERE